MHRHLQCRGSPLAKGPLSGWVSTHCECRVSIQVRPAAPALRKKGFIFPTRTAKGLWGCANCAVVLSLRAGLWEREQTFVCILSSCNEHSSLHAVFLHTEWNAAGSKAGRTQSNLGRAGSSWPIQNGRCYCISTGANVGLEFPDPS